MTSILVFEDNNDLRAGIIQLLNEVDRFVVLGDFPNCKLIRQQVAQANPDVILMDIDMPGITGIEAVKQIRQFNSKTSIIMLTVFDDNRHVFDAICAGASGYLLKKSIPDQLISAIDDVQTGGAPMSPGIAKMVIQSMHKVKQDQYTLTKREIEILDLLTKGNSLKMMASTLFVSVETIRSHLKKIYEKLQVHSQAEAVSKAFNERLI